MTDKARPARRRHPAARARIATAGVGLAAMAGLVANMQVTSGRAQGATITSSSAAPPQKTVVIVHNGDRPGSKAAKASKPIVLTAHAVVRTVSAPSSGGSGGSGGSTYVAPAPAAPAAAPVASTGGSAP